MDSEQHELEEKLDLEAKIDELTKTLDRMEDEWSEFQEIVFRLTVCKLTDPRYPFTAWEALCLQTKNERTTFRAVMRALQNRLDGKETPIAEQVEICAIPKDVLYASSKPSLAEVVDILKEAGRQNDTTLLEVMRAVKLEFEVDTEFGALAQFVLNGVRYARETP